MKRVVLLTLSFCLILVAGCSTAPTGSPGTPGPSVSPVQSFAQPSVLRSGNYSLISSIDHFEIDAKGSGRYIVNIYYRVTNTGAESNRLILYGNLTDKSGLFHGGLGVSHGGSGAQTFILDPNTTAIMRDYVTIDTERDYSSLKNGGAILDVVYADQKAPLEPIENLTSRWTLPPSIFT